VVVVTVASLVAFFVVLLVVELAPVAAVDDVWKYLC
jgi:hypothetical protein